MGTRSITRFLDHDGGDEICCMYRHFDGYPSGHGADLCKCLANIEHNGIHCLVASVIVYFKRGPRNIYVFPAGTRDMFEDFEYHVIIHDDDILVSVFEVVHDARPILLEQGTPSQVLEWCQTQDF